MFQMMMRSASACAALVVGALLAAGCRGQKPFAWARVEQGEVLTQGVVIRADNGSFQFAPGAPFPTALSVANCPRTPDTGNWSLVPDAQRVTVVHPASARPLHGLLAFCPVPPTTRQPSGRSHGIQIPDQYVAATEGGLVSVVFDVVEYQWDYRSDQGGVDSASEWPSWILWLKRDPFPGATANVGGVQGAVAR